MVWVVMIGAIGCCVFALRACVMRLRRLRALGDFVAESVLGSLRRDGVGALRSSAIPLALQEEIELALRADSRRARAAYTEVTLRVQAILDDGVGYERGGWRICAASSGAGVLLVVWSAPWVAGVVGIVGVCSAGVCAWIGRSADSRRRRARAAWNALIQGCSQSFTAKGEPGQ